MKLEDGGSWLTVNNPRSCIDKRLNIQEMIGPWDDFEEQAEADLLNEQLQLAYGGDAPQVCQITSVPNLKLPVMILVVDDITTHKLPIKKIIKANMKTPRNLKPKIPGVSGRLFGHHGEINKYNHKGFWGNIYMEASQCLSPTYTIQEG